MSPTFENGQNFNPKDYGGDQNFQFSQNKVVDRHGNDRYQFEERKENNPVHSFEAEEHPNFRKALKQVVNRYGDDESNVYGVSFGFEPTKFPFPPNSPRNFGIPDPTPKRSEKRMDWRWARQKEKIRQIHTECRKGSPDKIPEPRIEEANVDWILKRKEKEEHRQEIVVNVPEKEMFVTPALGHAAAVSSPFRRSSTTGARGTSRGADRPAFRMEFRCF
uniref:Uncharacterized protein n=1 Tax=Globodera rostochiensis TaxID=31243 RepID=A0A914H3T3_GLORO